MRSPSSPRAAVKAASGRESMPASRLHRHQVDWIFASGANRPITQTERLMSCSASSERYYEDSSVRGIACQYAFAIER